jgi:hypothetical protein
VSIRGSTCLFQAHRSRLTLKADSNYLSKMPSGLFRVRLASIFILPD